MDRNDWCCSMLHEIIEALKCALCPNTLAMVSSLDEKPDCSEAPLTSLFPGLSEATEILRILEGAKFRIRNFAPINTDEFILYSEAKDMIPEGPLKRFFESEAFKGHTIEIGKDGKKAGICIGQDFHTQAEIELPIGS